MRIVGWFLDDYSSSSPFSLHRIALLGQQFGKEIGEWFGPHTIAQVLR
jgi:cysteine protease ATG4